MSVMLLLAFQYGRKGLVLSASELEAINRKGGSQSV
jgi:hypothetical protein